MSTGNRVGCDAHIFNKTRCHSTIVECWRITFDGSYLDSLSLDRHSYDGEQNGDDSSFIHVLCNILDIHIHYLKDEALGDGLHFFHEGRLTHALR